MKYLSPAALFALTILVASACMAESTPAPDLEATVQAAVKATLDAQPTDTPAPDLETTVFAAVQATLIAEPTSVPSTDV